MRNHIPCLVHIIQLALGAFMSSLGVNGPTKTYEAHERDQQFGENERTVIGNSQRLWKEGNARIHKVSAMRPGLAEIIVKVRIWSNFDSRETDLDIALNACCIDYTVTWPSKRVHWQSKSQSPNCSTAKYGCENTMEFETGVAWVKLPVTRILTWVAEASKIQWLPATLHSTVHMDNCEVCHRCFKAIPTLDPLDVWMAYGYSA